MKLRERSFLIFRKQKHQLLEWKLHIENNAEKNCQTIICRCCLIAENIEGLSGWVMQFGTEANVGLLTEPLDKTHTGTEYGRYELFQVECYDFWEEFDPDRQLPLLWFCIRAEDITVVTRSQEKKIEALFQ